MQNLTRHDITYFYNSRNIIMNYKVYFSIQVIAYHFFEHLINNLLINRINKI